MSDRFDTEPVDAQVVDADGEPLDEAEEAVDGEPVLDDDRAWITPREAPPASTLAAVASPAVQAAAAVATGFVAGAATLAIVRHREARRSTRRVARRRAADALPIVGTRSFLIDVHMLRGDG